MYETFQKIGKKRGWGFEILHSEETFRKEGENFYCLLRKLMFGRYLLQKYRKDTIMVMEYKTIDEPTNEELEQMFQLGEEWLENNS